MIELPILSYKHRPEPLSNGVYEIDSKRGEIVNQKFSIILPRIWRELFTSVACLDIRNYGIKLWTCVEQSGKVPHKVL